jgi:hypothetical protein
MTRLLAVFLTALLVRHPPRAFQLSFMYKF